MRRVVLAASLALAGPVAAQGSRQWRPEERVVISDFSQVDALAASDAYVFVASRGGLGIYDRRFRRWEAPVTAADGFPRDPVVAALADPADESLWLATAVGLVHYLPFLHRFESIVVPGGVRDLMYDGQDAFAGVYLRTARGWEFLPRGAFIPEPARALPPAARRVRSLRADEVLQRRPLVDAMRAAVLVDDRLRTYRYTAAAEVPIADEVYLGTNGLGVLRLDVPLASFERLPFGLLAEGAASVLAVPDGVWVGTDERSLRAGISFVSEDLQRYEYHEGPRATGLGVRGIRALLGRGREIWAATDRGVVRFAPDGGTRVLDTFDGLPDDATYALAQGPSGVWVGTALGLAFVPDEGDVVPLGRNLPVPVLALSASRDTAWVGTTDGLVVATPDTGLLVPTDAIAEPELRGAIVAVAHVADTIVAASVDRVMWRAPGGRWTLERVISPEIGAVSALAADDGGVWIGGRRGIAFYRFAAREFRVYLAPGDVPGPVRDLVVSGRYLWVATEAGLVRFRRDALVP